MQLILDQMTKQCETKIDEVFPWDVVDMLKENKELLLVDVREPYEFDFAHITNSLNVPRGILETTASFGYEDTIPMLADSREKPIVLICRSGKRSLWAACTLQMLEFKKLYSMKTGV
ncbi:MAG: rhodanese-like domain-containing protein, partial [Pseudomonadota bacterium]